MGVCVCVCVCARVVFLPCVTLTPARSVCHGFHVLKVSSVCRRCAVLNASSVCHAFNVFEVSSVCPRCAVLNASNVCHAFHVLEDSSVLSMPVLNASNMCQTFKELEIYSSEQGRPQAGARGFPCTSLDLLFRFLQ